MIHAQDLFEVHMTVADLDRSVTFYRDAVGFRLAQQVRSVRPRSSGLVLPGTRCSDYGRPARGRSESHRTPRSAPASRMWLLRPARCAPRRHAPRLRRSTNRSAGRSRLDAGRVRLLSRSRRPSAGVHRHAPARATTRIRDRTMADVGTYARATPMADALQTR